MTEKRAALEHPVDAHRRSDRVDRGLVGSIGPVTGRKPVSRPLPHVARAVEEAKGVGVEGVHGTGSRPAVCRVIVVPKRPGEDVETMVVGAVRLDLVPPWETPAFQTTPGRKLPLGLGG